MCEKTKSAIKYDDNNNHDSDGKLKQFDILYDFHVNTSMNELFVRPFRRVRHLCCSSRVHGSNILFNVGPTNCDGKREFEMGS